MKKPFRYITPLFLLFLSGCQTYSAVSSFNNNEIYAKSLQSTKKVDILENNKIKLMFTVTYLNEVYPQTKDETKFLLSLFEVDSKSFINKAQLQAKLNNATLISLEKLAKNDLMRENLVLKNPWAKYFIIKFKNNLNKKYTSIKTKNKKQELELKYKDFNWVKLTF